MSSLAKKGAWVALDNMSAAALAFLFFVLTARYLSQEEFGVAALALGVIQIAQPLIESLFHDALIQKTELSDADIATAASASVVWSFVLTAAICVFSPFISEILSTPSLAIFLVPLSSICIFTGLAAVPAAIARRHMEFRRLAIRTILGRITGIGIGLAMLWQGFGVWSVVAQAIISSGLSAALLLVASPRPTGRLNWIQLKPLILFGLPTVGTQFLWYANSRLITLIIGGALGPIAAGNWNVATRFVEPLQALLATTVGQFLLPLLARKNDESHAMQQPFLTGTHAMATVLMPSFFGLAACSPIALVVLVGEKWLEAAPIMQLVCLVNLALLIRQLAEIALTVSGRPRYTFYTHIIATSCSLIGSASGAYFGLMPSVCGWSTRAIPFLTINVIFVTKVLGISYIDQISPLWRPLTASCVMVAVILYLEHEFGSSVSSINMLLIMISAGIITYGSTLLCFDPTVKAIVLRRI
ncbi:oligosaccharide flippase family protein [Methylobacterium longum]|uniref:Oligosaccharide flippase family protein n=1 Tax=Methylobacterium longum TaxID=767694 RepID=A0ABT8AZ81_9HYPH|nr:oligosaccharide flippase family protein [Methylobacterium longum]MDN3574558.1 oligosaccharide flippase family protein [Methylobacterium longum]GJE15018.1 Lipopolysaccharide biosynthesis protein WzxC [Methylobacterium longum]